LHPSSLRSVTPLLVRSVQLGQWYNSIPDGGCIPIQENSMRKPSFALVMLALALVIVTLPAAAQQNAADVAAAIVRLENSWADAQKAGDAAKVAPMLAESFVNTDVDGNISGKSQLLSNLKGGKWEHNAISDVKVTVYGDTAIATGAWAGKGVDGDVTRIDRRERWTDAWVKMSDGKWQCVASQQSAVKK